MDDIDVEIKNCNNIEYGKIKILKNKLNIKYGINGTGKSSIAKAIEYYIKKENGDEIEKTNYNIEYNKLKPYKYFANENINCEITGIGNFQSVMVFNQDYVSKFLFNEIDLHKNSFEVFVKHNEYDKIISEINKNFESLKNITSIESEIGKTINEFLIYLENIAKILGKATKSGISKSSKFCKTLENGNKLENIHEDIKEFTNYIKSDKNAKWLKWHHDAKEFREIEENVCPYCIDNITEKECKINKLEDEYEVANINNLNAIIEVIENLSKYFSDTAKSNLIAITKNIEGIPKENINYLGKVQQDIETMIIKLYDIKNIDYSELKNDSNFEIKLESYKILIDLIENLKSEETSKIVDEINKEIDNIKINAGKLKGLINTQTAKTLKEIEKNKIGINSFLKYSGIKYYIEFIGTDDRSKPYRMIMKHLDISESVQQTTAELSYGEKNAFSLVLFMYDCINKNPDLIILDDPISSFDVNKKFAIIEKLFKNEDGLRNKTVLLLTHDFENIINMIHVHSGNYNVRADFLYNDRGVVQEKGIDGTDIKSIIELTQYNILNANNLITPLIHLRRKYEILGLKNNAYELLSSIFKKREKPSNKDGDILYNDDFILKGQEEIKQEMKIDFKYLDYYKIVTDDDKMIELYRNATSNYEKLHLYRIIKSSEMIDKNEVIKKFINQTYHVENDFLFQLNPLEYQLVPFYIIDECDKELGIGV